MGDATAAGAVLFVGIACLDVIDTVDHYPHEDEQMRVLSQRRSCGGNATNAAVVTRGALEEKCSLLTALGEGQDTDFVVAQLRSIGVDLSLCRVTGPCDVPNSHIILNSRNGSRTILHHRALPELQASDIGDPRSLSSFGWVHFEGRNMDVTREMAAAVQRRNAAAWATPRAAPIVCSMELEKKTLKNYEPHLELTDVVFISKDFARHNGYATPHAAIDWFRTKLHERPCIVVCPWGEKGADACDADGSHVHCDAFAPPAVVDTLAAGDTFIAGFISEMRRRLREPLRMACERHEEAEPPFPAALVDRDMLEGCLRFACALAGHKVGVVGVRALTVPMR